MPTINDVARMAGVSTATVSRTFRTPALLTEETQQRVEEAAKKLNYRPRGLRKQARLSNLALAEPLSQQPLSAIGFQFFADRPEDTLQTNTFYAALFMGAQREAAALGLPMLVHTTDRHQVAQELPPMVQERTIAGLLLVGNGADTDTLPLFTANVPHLVLLDSKTDSGQYECVVSDGFGGMYDATRYLLDSGHRRIAFFLAEENVSPFRDRLHGYLAALFDSGITADPTLVIGGKFEDSYDLRNARLTELFQRPDAPTALLAANDEHAIFAISQLARLGKRVPEDVSVIGFDDIPLVTHLQPALTTVHVDREEMGRLAVRRLYARIQEGEAAGKPVTNAVPVSLVIRQSCRPR